jgi:hypothetical protein
LLHRGVHRSFREAVADSLSRIRLVLDGRAFGAAAPPFAISSSRRVFSLPAFQAVQRDRHWARQEARPENDG